MIAANNLETLLENKISSVLTVGTGVYFKHKPKIPISQQIHNDKDVETYKSIEKLQIDAQDQSDPQDQIIEKPKKFLSIFRDKELTKKLENYDSNQGFRHLQIEADDQVFQNLILHFLECFKFIDYDIDQGRNVLVHCAAGVSRSATIVISYLMYKNQLTLDQAFEHVKECRPAICPNEGFMKQLTIFETILSDEKFPLQKKQNVSKLKKQYSSDDVSTKDNQEDEEYNKLLKEIMFKDEEICDQDPIEWCNDDDDGMPNL
eukprot:403342619